MSAGISTASTELRHVVEKICKRTLGDVDNAIVAQTVTCIRLETSKDDVIAKLQPKLSDKTEKFVNKLFSKLDKIDLKRLSEPDINPENAPKKLKLDDNPPVKVPIPDVSSEKDSQKVLSPAEIQRMMNDAKKILEDRKKVLAASDTDASAKAARAAELRNRINSALGQGFATPAVPGVNAATANPTMSGLATPGGFLSVTRGLATPIFPGIQTPAFLKPGDNPYMEKPAEPMPGPLVLDDEGQTVNTNTGERLSLAPRMPTLKANIRAKKREEFKQLLTTSLTKKESQDVKPSSSQHFDPRIDINPAVRPVRKNFKFHEEGKFQAIGKKIKMKAQLEKLHAEISEAAKRTGIQAAVKLALVQPKVEHQEGHLPVVEWWDGVLLPNNSYDDCRKPALVNKNGKVEKYNTITHLVEHPTQVASPDEAATATPIKLYLTKKETKKFRRQRRREEEKERTEKIRLGLQPPPEPKVKISNLMRVLGNDAIQDPTKIEAHVRAQMAKRQRAHELANAARKLTAEQRRQKKLEKLKEDISTGVHVAVYRVNTLFNPSHKYKVVENAKQYLMTGIAMITQDICVVIVEGGPKQQNKFRNLMMRRIQWKEDIKKRASLTTDDKLSQKLKNNKCELVWEGSVKHRTFPELKPKIFPTVASVREHLKRLGVEHYWDLAHAQAVLQSTDAN